MIDKMRELIVDDFVDNAPFIELVRYDGRDKVFKGDDLRDLMMHASDEVLAVLLAEYVYWLGTDQAEHWTKGIDRVDITELLQDELTRLHLDMLGE